MAFRVGVPKGSGLKGALVEPKQVYLRRRFNKVVLNPPNFEPGSWRGAGNCTWDDDSDSFWLVTRPRTNERRGYAFEVYSSRNGEEFTLVSTMTKESVSEALRQEVLSIEGQQLVKDPATGRFYLYLAVDIGRTWKTAMLSSEDPRGPWRPEGIVISNDATYDSREARDAVVSVLGGTYYAIYKASDGQRVNASLAASSDGRRWRKTGPLTIDGNAQPPFHFVYGTILEGSPGPVFVGFESANVISGAAVSRRFVSYLVNHRSNDLKSLYAAEWKPLSPFERGDFPVHSYCSLVADRERKRILLFVEAIDPEFSKEVGLNLEVDRVLLYTASL